MEVVAVINYKGGVGKTTLTANIGAELARRGKRVLLVDLDPQASLTFSFYTTVDWEKELAANRTIRQWYETLDDRSSALRLADLVTTPERVNSAIGHSGGRLDMIASHLELINIDLDLAAELGGGTAGRMQSNFLRVHRRLADGLAESAFERYDVVLIDCPPNFNITTKTAIIACDRVLVPAKPDYLSTLGIGYLRRKTRELVEDYNTYAGTKAGQKIQAGTIEQPEMRVVFTMIQRYAGEPIAATRKYIKEIEDLGIDRLTRMLRDNKTLFAGAGETGLPAVLSQVGNEEALDELDRIVDEFTAWVEG